MPATTTQPRVALETAFLTRGLPRGVAQETARDMADAVRAAGATPCFVGVLDGEPIVGLDHDQLARVAESDVKLTTADLAVAAVNGTTGGTTVAATVFLAHRAGLVTAATGGIGGVHAGDGPPDVSADLLALSRTPVILVCSGAKAILDLPATVELLETLGVLVVGFGTDEWPAFWTPSSGIPLTHSVQTESEIAALWRAAREFAVPGAMLVCVPPPPETALTAEASQRAVEHAIELAADSGLRGGDVTPFLLDRISRYTEGRSLTANTTLLVHNAAVGGAIAVAVGGR